MCQASRLQQACVSWIKFLKFQCWVTCSLFDSEFWCWAKYQMLDPMFVCESNIKCVCDAQCQVRHKLWSEVWVNDIFVNAMLMLLLCVFNCESNINLWFRCSWLISKIISWVQFGCLYVIFYGCLYVIFELYMFPVNKEWTYARIEWYVPCNISFVYICSYIVRACKE